MFSGLLAIALLASVLNLSQPPLRANAQVAARRPEASDTSEVVILSVTSRVFGNRRSIRVYLPPGYRDRDSTRRYPALYFNDGFAVFARHLWNAQGVLDSLIRAGAIPPVIAVGIDNAASIPGATTPLLDRAAEYLPYPDASEPALPKTRGSAYPSFLLDEVVPMVEQRFRVRSDPLARGVAGASYGAIAALYAVMRRPRAFGLLLLESAPLFLFDGRLASDATRLDDWPAAVYIGIGTRETSDSTINARGGGLQDSLANVVRRVSPRSRVMVNRVEGATHTSAAWRQRLPTALVFLLRELGA